MEFAGDFSWTNRLDVFFLIAIIGWMPAPIDVSVWQSLWTLEKNKSLGYKPKLKEAQVDFKIGYVGTILLAIAFLTLGAYVLYGTGKELSSSGAAFADQLINMYTINIGAWSYYFIAIAALTTMFSTTITIPDAYPRVMKPLTAVFLPNIKRIKTKIDWESWFWIGIVVMGVVKKVFPDLTKLLYTLNKMRKPPHG